MEELEEEELSLLVDDVGRERARNLTTDLLLYLQQSQYYKLQVLWTDPPGRAHENSIFSRRAKVDVLLQHQCCTSSCMSACLNNLMFLSRLPEFHKICESSHLPCNPIPALSVHILSSHQQASPFSLFFPVLSPL